MSALAIPGVRVRLTACTLCGTVVQLTCTIAAQEKTAIRLWPLNVSAITRSAFYTFRKRSIKILPVLTRYLICSRVWVPMLVTHCRRWNGHVLMKTVSRYRIMALGFFCDGGYHGWPCLACPFQQQPAGPIGNWSTSVESTRKDIECAFGILKKRFLILKNPIRQQIKHNIERMFLTCSVLHNMTMEEEDLHDWMIDDDDEEVYDPLSKLVERNLRKKRNVGEIRECLECAV